MSYHPADIIQKYCGACHQFHDYMTVTIPAAAAPETKDSPDGLAVRPVSAAVRYPGRFGATDAARAVTGTAASSPAEPLVTATRWEVSCLPEDHADYRRSIVTIEQRGPNSCAVVADGYVYDAEGAAAVEPRPSERSEEWLARYRHDYATAVVVASKLARQSASVLTGEPHRHALWVAEACPADRHT